MDKSENCPNSSYRILANNIFKDFVRGIWKNFTFVHFIGNKMTKDGQNILILLKFDQFDLIKLKKDQKSGKGLRGSVDIIESFLQDNFQLNWTIGGRDLKISKISQ